MPDRPVSLVVWRDAKKEPPKRGSRVLVDRPILAHTPVFAYRSGLDDKYKMWSDPHGTLDPQPSVWCDPVPPSEDALTLDDLRLAAHYADYCADDKLAARLRRAIEAAEKQVRAALAALPAPPEEAG